MLRTTSSLYTPSGKLARATDPNGNFTRFAYDVLDRQVAATDALGRQTQYGYDALSRMISVSNPGIRLTPPLLQQAWTRNGQRASLTDANSNTTAFAYDGLDRLAATTYPGGSSEGLTYDASSNIASRTTQIVSDYVRSTDAARGNSFSSTFSNTVTGSQIEIMSLIIPAADGARSSVLKLRRNEEFRELI